jgi:hypothetical protein
MSLSLIAALALATGPPSADVGPLVRALWLLQRHGTVEAVDPVNDQRLGCDRASGRDYAAVEAFRLGVVP